MLIKIFKGVGLLIVLFISFNISGYFVDMNTDQVSYFAGAIGTTCGFVLVFCVLEWLIGKARGNSMGRARGHHRAAHHHTSHHSPHEM